MTKKPVDSKTQNRKPVSGHFDASGNFTADELSQIEEFVRVGCVAMQQPASIEDRQRIGATALHLIARLKESQAPKPESTEP